MTVEGKGWKDTESFYERLPARARGLVTEKHWKHAQCSAGMTVHFTTNSPSLCVRWDGFRDHAGYSGLDLYVRHNGKWRWLAVAAATQSLNAKTLFSELPVQPREYLLYLPLFHQVQQVAVGIPAGFDLKATPPRNASPIVFYGTSITQGSRASRAGMTYCAILGRWLDTPVLNLGFSGNGNMEPGFVDLLCELAPSVYVVDCLPNMTAPLVEERAEIAIRKLLSAHAETPIVLVEMVYADAFLKPCRMTRCRAANNVQHAVYERLVREGLRNLHYVRADTLIGTDGDATIDGTHYTDLGYRRYAETLYETLAAELRLRIF